MADSHRLEDQSMHVLLKGKGDEKKGCVSSIVSDNITASKTIYIGVLAWRRHEFRDVVRSDAMKNFT